ncbi:MAG: peptidoglycan-binding domain-containing protein [Pyrinomonadaceae bacterium]
MARTIPMSLGDLPTIYNVDFPVGPNMPNLRDDVLLVQTLMKMANFTRNNQGLGPVEASRDIKVDGFFGPQTKRMIVAFEEDRTSSRRLLVSDGIIEPSSKDGFTGKGVLFKIVHLNRSAKFSQTFTFEYDALPFLPTTHPLLRPSISNGAVRPAGV